MRLTIQRLFLRAYQQIGNRVLGANVAQRVRIGRSLIASAIYAACLAMMYVGVRFGLTDPSLAKGVAVCSSLGSAGFYIALRSGWSHRFADPAMTVAQMLFAVVVLALSYAVNPAVRSAVLLIVALVMVFGMFSLSPRQARWMTLVTVVLFGTVMGGLSVYRPAVYDARMELLHFMILAAVLPTIGSLAGQLSRLRSRLRQHRTALQRALQQLEVLVRHDELTGLANRRHMQERLEQEVRRRELDPAPVCVCLLDLDHFKRINDNFGHAAGDEVLRRFARQALAALRNTDVLARWGGEEFLVLLPGTDAAHACLVMDRLRAFLSDPLAWQDRPELAVTVSAGVAQWQPGESAVQVIERADQQAYRAKTAGRDRWSCDSFATVEPA